jgi:hypothetical protein
MGEPLPGPRRQAIATADAPRRSVRVDKPCAKRQIWGATWRSCVQAELRAGHLQFVEALSGVSAARRPDGFHFDDDCFLDGQIGCLLPANNAVAPDGDNESCVSPAQSLFGCECHPTLRVATVRCRDALPHGADCVEEYGTPSRGDHFSRRADKTTAFDESAYLAAPTTPDLRSGSQSLT